jgi:hypothetical protein
VAWRAFDAALPIAPDAADESLPEKVVEVPARELSALLEVDPATATRTVLAARVTALQDAVRDAAVEGEAAVRVR